MIVLKGNGSATLELAADAAPASRWTAYPPILELVPAGDGRSCLATPKPSFTPRTALSGRCTVKAVDASRIGVGYFSLAVVDDPAPAVAAAEPTPVAGAQGAAIEARPAESSPAEPVPAPLAAAPA